MLGRHGAFVVTYSRSIKHAKPLKAGGLLHVYKEILNVTVKSLTTIRLDPRKARRTLLYKS